MAYGKKVKRRKTLGKPVVAIPGPIPGYGKMVRAKRMAEVQMFRDDLRQAEMRRNYMLELGNIRSALYGNLSPGVQHPLHSRRDENKAVVLKAIQAENFVASLQ